MPASGDKILAADVDDLGDYTIRAPLVRLIQQAAQSIPHNTNTAATFGASSEDIDTHGFHDTASNTSRITPTVAGYYLLTGCYVTVAAADYTNIGCSIFKNGASAGIWDRRGPNVTNVVKTAYCDAILSANGSSDYFELDVYHTNGAVAARNTSTGTGFATTFEAIFLRPL